MENDTELAADGPRQMTEAEQGHTRGRRGSSPAVVDEQDQRGRPKLPDGRRHRHPSNSSLTSSGSITDWLVANKDGNVSDHDWQKPEAADQATSATSPGDGDSRAEVVDADALGGLKAASTFGRRRSGRGSRDDDRAPTMKKKKNSVVTSADTINNNKNKDGYCDVLVDDNDAVINYNTSDSNDENASDDETHNFLSQYSLDRPRITIDRKAMNQGHFHERLHLWAYLSRLIPILVWLPRYQWRRNFMPDFSAGFTVAVMHIPQGMAYALLALVDPIVGIYTAFFPVIMYIFLGTSRHVSLGTFAVISILVSKTVANIATLEDVPFMNTLNGSQSRNYSAIEVVTAVSLVSGAFQVLFSFLRLGTLCSLLSHALIRGFTTGAAIHVFSSQVKYMLGLKLPRFSGPFALFAFYSSLFSQLADTNYVTLGISVSVIALLEVYTQLLEAKLTKKLKGINFPIHLLVVILGITVSFVFNLSDDYDVDVVGEVRTGLPSPSLPPVELFPDIAVDALIVAIVCYVVAYSLGVLFANKYRYKVGADQELFAQGVSNIFGSFFSSLPVSGSLSRTSVQDNAGCKTLMTSAVSVFFLLWVLLFAGPLFRPLPNAVLSALIVHALKGMFKQFLDLPPLLTTSRTDFSVWTLTFVATVVLNVDMGLMVGVGLNLVLLLYWALDPQVVNIVETDFKDLQVNSSCFHDGREDSSIVVLKLMGDFNFSNASRVLDRVESAVEQSHFPTKPKSVLLDLAGLPRMDLTACQAIVALSKHLRTKQMKLFIIGASGDLWRKFEVCRVFDEVNRNRFFPSTQDALAIIRHKENASSFQKKTNAYH